MLYKNQYELYMKLKKAGFRQIFSSRGVDLYVGKDEKYGEYYVHYGSKKRAIVPELCTLIEECGEYFGKIEKIDDGWKCVGGIVPIEGHMVYPFHCYGKNPEEAVANLWIKLNENYDITK